MNRKRLMVVGNTTADHVFRLASELTLDGKSQCDSYEVAAGGQAANVAVTLAFLGFEVLFVGAFGDDSGAALSREAFKAAGVDVGLSTSIDGCPHYAAAILVGGAVRTIIMYRDPRLKLDCDVLTDSAIEGCSAVYSDGHEQMASLRLSALAAARGTTMVLDLEVATEESALLARCAGHLVAPAEIVCKLASEPSPERAVVALASSGIPAVIATMGAEGSVGCAAGSDTVVRSAAAPSSVVDTTGAGDAYHTGYLASLVRGGSLSERMHFASALAAAKCAVAGPRLRASDCVRFRS